MSKKSIKETQVKETKPKKVKEKPLEVAPFANKAYEEAKARKAEKAEMRKFHLECFWGMALIIGCIILVGIVEAW